MTKVVHQAPPAAPGSLGVAAAPRELLDYLSKATSWRDWLAATLDELDRRAKAAVAADDLTADITLAYALWQSINARLDEVLATWDSGRVGEPERQRISELLWGRLGGRLDAALAVSFAEACVLADALVDRLRDRLDADALGTTGVGDTAEAVRSTLQRCRALPGGSARAPELQALAASVDAALHDATTGVDVRERLARHLREAATIERDLIVEGAARSAIARDTADLTRRVAAALAGARAARDLAARCAEKILDPPRLAVPDPGALGPVPATADDWRAHRTALDAYATRLEQVELALAEATRRHRAPLDRRSELRGLLDAYRDMAQVRGVVERPEIAAAYASARSVLYTAPLDLTEGEVAVKTFDDTLRACLAGGASTTAGSDPDRRAEDA